MEQQLTDIDLISIQEARTLCENAYTAYKTFAEFSQESVDKIVRAVAVAVFTASDKLAKMAVEETGFGKYEDKILKNMFGSRDVYQYIKNMKTVGIIKDDKENGIWEIAEPMGVVAGIIPSTNPTSTAVYKTLISIKSRNAIVMSPHPAATKCVLETTRLMTDAARKNGAPPNLIQCMENTTLPGTSELMKNRKSHVILATGGMGLVRAAYSSGKPAFGVGPGNVPAYIDRTAEINKAVADIITGKTFDNGTICASEQSIVCDEPVKDKVLEELKNQNCYLADDEERIKLEAVMIQYSGAINPKIVGQPAVLIAKLAGVQVPKETRAIVVFLEGVGKEYPLSCEKLSPVLSFYPVNGWEEGCKKCIEILNFGGMGHSLAIHCKDEKIIREFGLHKPAFRISVNTPSTLGAIGFTTSLPPAMTLGPGTFAGSITSENISPLHLMHTKRVAFETKPAGKTSFDLSVSSFDHPKKSFPG
ncbi:MAG: aldehyde dehydrogenase family protein, partial [bacterium]|nr:aldehyde dehydrogenase family protein [bacterium]